MDQVTYFLQIGDLSTSSKWLNIEGTACRISIVGSRFGSQKFGCGAPYAKTNNVNGVCLKEFDKEESVYCKVQR